MKYIIAITAIALLLAGTPQADASITVTISHTSKSAVRVHFTPFYFDTNLGVGSPGGGWSAVGTKPTMTAGLGPKLSGGTDLHLGTGNYARLWRKPSWKPASWGNGSVFYKSTSSSGLPFGPTVQQGVQYLALPQNFSKGTISGGSFDVDVAAGVDAYAALGLRGGTSTTWGAGQDQFTVRIQKSLLGGQNVPEPSSVLIFGLLAAFGVACRRR